MTTTKELSDKLKSSNGFIGVFSRNELPKIKSLPASLVINTDPSYRLGEHWVAIYINEDGFGVYFDSYGLSPLIQEFIGFLNNNCPNGWTYNSTTVQGLHSITCGEYCVLFVYMSSIGYSLCKIIKLFTSDLELNDKIIDNIYKKL